jgi:hypothetical protein
LRLAPHNLGNEHEKQQRHERGYAAY